MGERGRSRGTFGGHGAAGDGRDTAADDGTEGANDHAHGANHGGRNTTSHDPTNSSGGGYGHDRWVIADHNHKGA